MTLFHVIGSLDPAMGGLPRAVVALASAQARSGLNVVIGSPGPHPSKETLTQWTVGTVLPENVRFETLPRNYGMRRSGALETQLEKAGIDWLQVHGCWELELHAAMRWAVANDVPYGITPHSMLHPWHQSHHRILKWILKKAFGVQQLWKKAHAIQVLTTEEHSHWEQELGTVETLHVIPNGIDPQMDPGDSGQKHEFLPDSPFLLFLGRLAPQKNPQLLLDAFLYLADRYPELHVVFAGPDYGEEKALRNKARAAGVQDRVHFPGMIQGQVKWDAYHRCGAFCLPSNAEGFSLALLEACLAKAPCFISNECGFPELVEAEGAGLIPETGKAFAECLEPILQNPEMAKGMGNHAHQLVTSDYSWEKIVGQFNQMIAGTM